MGHLETIEGTGRLFEKDKFVLDVRYHLEVYQQVVQTGPGKPPVRGLKEVVGKLSYDDPIHFYSLVGQDLTLHLADGRTLDLFLKDNHGTIAPRGGIRIPG